MKIITPGKVPVPTPKKYRGHCSHCGCVFECEKDETRLGQFIQNNRFYKGVCPTQGCGESCIMVVEIPK